MRPVLSRSSALLLLYLLLALLGSAVALAFVPVGPSWTRSLVIAAGDKRSLAGGFSLTRNVDVHGTVRVRSCCGFSTNDISFRIGDQLDYGGARSFGIIVDTFSFEWNSGQNYKYEFIFDNAWIICGGTPFNCAGNETSPSYHAKTVELTVRESDPLGSYLLDNILFLAPYLALVGIVVIWRAVVFLREREDRALSKKEGSLN